MKSRLFISYSRKDLDFARRVSEDIRNSTDIIPWIDLSGIRSGSQFINVIISAINSCDIIIFLMSKNSIASSFVSRELSYGARKYKTIIALSIDGIDLPIWLKELSANIISLSCKDNEFPNNLTSAIKSTLFEITNTEEYGTINNYPYIDLGLSVCWAASNILENNIGLPIAWGETDRKDSYNKDNYKYLSHEEGLSKITRYNDKDMVLFLQSEDDAASIKWGSAWRMPTKAEFEELQNNCKWIWCQDIELSGKKRTGYLIISNKNHNSIFLPINYISRSQETGEIIDSYGLYWTSQANYYKNNTAISDKEAWCLNMNNHMVTCDSQERWKAMGVRPVFDRNAIILPYNSSHNHISSEYLSGNIVICCVWKDKNVAESISDRLDERIGQIPIIDIEPERIDKNDNDDISMSDIAHSCIVVFIISDISIQSERLRKKVRYAFNIGKTVIPVTSNLSSSNEWFSFEFSTSKIIDSLSEPAVNEMIETVGKMMGIRQNDLCIPEQTIKDFSEGMAPVKVNDHWGYVNREGHFTIQPQYEDGWGFVDGCAKVKCNGLWGFINKTGKVIIPCQYSHLSDFHDGLAFYRTKEGLCGYLTKNGERLIDCSQFDECGNFCNGIARVKKNSKYGFIGTDGSVVIPIEYDSVGIPSEGLVRVSKHMTDRRTGFVTTKGEAAIGFWFENAGDFHEGFAKVQSPSSHTWGFIDKKMNLVLDFQFKSTSDFHQGRIAVETIQGNKGILDKEKKCYARFEGCVQEAGYKENMVFIQDREYYIMIDLSGELGKGFQYSEAHSFNEGRALVKQKHYGYIDKNEEFVIPPIYTAAGDFHEGRCVVLFNRKWHILNEIGEEIPIEQVD